MPRYEYKVVPAPEQGKKGRGIKGPKGRFAHALETVMNSYGAEGWDYVRTDTLPFEERQGLTGKTTRFQNLLVFRRVLTDAATDRADDLSDTQVAGLLAAPTETPPAPPPARNTQSAAAGAVAALSAYRAGRSTRDLAAE